MSGRNIARANVTVKYDPRNFQSFLKIESVTAELFLIWTNVALTNFALTNVTMTVRICSR